MENQNNGGPRSDIENWVQSLDREVNALVRSNSSLRTIVEGQSKQLDSIEAAMTKMTEREIKPRTPWQTIAALIAVVGVMITMLELRLAPSELIAQAVYEDVQNFKVSSAEADFQFVQHEAQANKRLDELERKFIHEDELIHVLEKRMDDLNREVGELKATTQERTDIVQRARTLTYTHDGGPTNKPHP